jgi:(p)ppGpp synthase/HD superfamily hydrolase
MLSTAPPPFVEGRPLLRSALEWAADLHASQVRDVDQAPFILHPLEVAALLASRGFEDEVVVAGLLHDAVEKSEAGIGDIRERFGDRVAEMVAAVTEDPAISDYAARKAALRDGVVAAGPEAHAVYVADKITKARELRAEGALDDPELQQRLEHYEQSLAMLGSVARGLSEALAFELWALRTLPPTPA